jgi:CRISPR/Cas system CSM-associated protein Csm2 small subunit
LCPVIKRQDEHGQDKREGKQKGKSDKRITDSKARQMEALHSAQTQTITLRKLLGYADNKKIVILQNEEEVANSLNICWIGLRITNSKIQ